MPIDMTEFETGSEATATERKHYKEDVEKMLKKKKAFTTAEVAEKLGVRSPQARAALMQLIKEGKAERKSVEVDGKTLIYYAKSRGEPETVAEE